MRHIYLTLLLIAAVAGQMLAYDLPDEDLHYSILYKWGLINKQAATAVLSLRSDGQHYHAKLAAKTVPWADRVFRVRDTLESTMLRQGCLPQIYRKNTHEGGTYNRDIVRYSRNGDEVSGYASRYRRKKNGQVSESDTVLHAIGMTVDMLSVFYYLRTIDFADMAVGSEIHLNVFSGKKVEKLRVRYDGIETIKIEKKAWQAYHLSFAFTHNGEQSSDSMSTWISADDNRIPIKLEGILALGKVHAYFTGAQNAE